MGNIQHEYIDVPPTIVRDIRDYFSENTRRPILNSEGDHNQDFTDKIKLQFAAAEKLLVNSEDAIRIFRQKSNNKLDGELKKDIY